MNQSPQDSRRNTTVIKMPTSVNPSSGQKSFCFLDLPTEIRLMIYKDALACRDPSGVIDFTVRKALKNHTALLCTNKLINRESTPIFRAINIFRFYISFSALRSTLLPAALINPHGIAQGVCFKRIDLDVTNHLDNRVATWLKPEHWSSVQSDVKKVDLNKLQQLRLSVDRALRTIHTCGGDPELCWDPDFGCVRRATRDGFRLHVLLTEAYSQFLVADIGWDRVAYKSEPYRTSSCSATYIPRHIAKLVKKGEAIESEVRFLLFAVLSPLTRSQYTEVFRVIGRNSTGLRVVNMERYRTGYSTRPTDPSSVPRSEYLELESILGEAPSPLLRKAMA